MSRRIAFYPFLALAGLTSMLALADGPEIERRILYGCLLNKSETMNIIAESRAGVLERVVLERKFFLHREPKLMAELDHPVLLDYGNVFMLLQDYGRSGYAFIRIERKQGGHEGLVDLNLFNNPHSTGGQLVPMPCHRPLSHEGP